MVIDDAIPEKSVDESGDAISLKKNDDGSNSSQNDDVEKKSPKKETTPITSKRETRLSQVPLSLLTPLECNLQYLVMMSLLHQRNHCQE